MITCPTCGTSNPAQSATCSACGTALQDRSATANTSSSSSEPQSVALPRDFKLRDGNYVIGPVLGQGGFGITYKAGDMSLQRFVAIKEFFPFGAGRNRATVQPTGSMTQSSFEETKKKFIEEARTLARFNHPSIVRVFGVWEELNTAYMAMEFLEGKTLQRLIEEKGSIPEKTAVGFIKTVADALERVHEAGLIHRDIKPDNICVTNDGRTVLIDFGTARAFASGKTVKQTAMLTPGYAPLEQYGQQARFGSFSDVYALGATLYHCLTGRMPAPATDRVSGVDVPAPEQINPSISPAVSRAVMWAMQIKATERPQTMREFLGALEAPAAPAPPSPHVPPPQPGFNTPHTQVSPQPQAQPQPQQQPPPGSLGGNYAATRVGDGQILTNASPAVALSAIWRGFSSFGVNNPTIDFLGSRVLGSTPMDLRSYGQNVTGVVSQDPRGTLVSIRSESGMPFNLTDFGRSSGERRDLTQHVEQALVQAPPNGYLPGGMPVQNQSYTPPSAPTYPAPNQYAPPAPGQYAPPIAPVNPTYPPPNPYGGPGYQNLPQRRGGEVLTYALLGIFCCGIMAPIAWVRGNAALAEYGDLDPGDRGTVVAGRIIGIIGTVLTACWLLLFLIGMLSDPSSSPRY